MGCMYYGVGWDGIFTMFNNISTMITIYKGKRETERTLTTENSYFTSYVLGYGSIWFDRPCSNVR